jgi:eukaryotic-like serine/threonine-protein kinase
MGWVSRKYAELVEKQVAEMEEKQKMDRGGFVPPVSEPDRVRDMARFTSSDGSQDVFFAMAVTQTVMVAMWPLIWIVWAFVTRGGLSFLIMGLALVRRDGRPATRVQCAWRALLFWVPVTGLTVASVWLDAAFWAAWPDVGAHGWMLTASPVAWWASVLLLPLYAALALSYPQRSLHDWLAGTYVVPR